MSYEFPEKLRARKVFLMLMVLQAIVPWMVLGFLWVHSLIELGWGWWR